MLLLLGIAFALVFLALHTHIVRRRATPLAPPHALGVLMFSASSPPSEEPASLASSQSNIGRTQEAHREREIAEALLRLVSELPRSSDLDRVLDEALRLVNGFVGARRGVILLAQPERKRLILRASLEAGTEIPEGGRPSPYSRGQGLAGWIIEHGQPIVIDDLIKDSRWVRHEDAEREHRSALGVPLTINEETLGAMLFFSSRPGAFHTEQLTVVTAAATQVAAAIYNAELYRLIRDQAAQQGGMIREKRIEASKSSAILESIAEGVLVTDQQNRISLFNAAAEEILGLRRTEALGKPASDFIGLYGEAGHAWLQAVQRWSDGEVQGNEAPLEAQLELEDEERIVALSTAPVLHDGEFVGTVTTFRDVTREVEVDRLKSEFVATVSHELRTPMTSIKGYVEMLLMEAVGDINAQQRKFLQTIKTNIDRLGGLVNDLLDISRIESGRVSLELEPINVADILSEMREVFRRRSRLESKPMSIEIQAEPSLPPVAADRDRLRQILTNLIENSFNYTPPNGTIELTAEQREDTIMIAVDDTGIGIAPEEQERVFERFFRGEQALNLSVGGTGLGLSIVRQLIRMHGGELKLSSEGVPGQGTSFAFTLPIHSPQDSGIDS
ncbi:MAG: ATP-binding protein [Anaerolineales bacterium]|nr:ATP-binding protein [Anaerolineales bacterium]